MGLVHPAFSGFVATCLAFTQLQVCFDGGGLSAEGEVA